MVVVASAQSPAAGAPKVLLLSGKPAAAAAAAGAPGGRNVPLMLPGQRGASSEAESGGPPLARKRQRLTHLSPEEKALRRWARAWSEIGSETGPGGLGLDRAALGRPGPGGSDASAARRGAGREVCADRIPRSPWRPGCSGVFPSLFCLVRAMPRAGDVEWPRSSRPAFLHLESVLLGLPNSISRGSWNDRCGKDPEVTGICFVV